MLVERRKQESVRVTSQTQVVLLQETALQLELVQVTLGMARLAIFWTVVDMSTLVAIPYYNIQKKYGGKG